MRYKNANEDNIVNHDLWAYWDKYAGEYRAGPHTGHFRDGEGHFSNDKPHGSTRDSFNQSVAAAYGKNATVRVIYGRNDYDMVSHCDVRHASFA